MVVPPAADLKTMPAPNLSMQTPSVQPSLIQQNQVEGNPAQKPEQQTNTGMENPYANNFAAELNLPPKVLETKVMGAILGGLFFFGMMFGCAVFGGGNTTSTVQGLNGVIQNPAVQNDPNVLRCGTVDPNSACVLYIMNAKTRDRLGSDFYQEAQEITGMPAYSIQLSNVNYANELIRPGHIAQLYIPARR
jgi:hypothetical protein